MRLISAMGIVGALAMSVMGCGGSSTKAPSDMQAQQDLGGGNVTLTIKNYLAWCQISASINGGTAQVITPAQTSTLSVPAGASVTLTSPGTTNNATFQWGYWQGVDSGDLAVEEQGSGSDHAVTFTVDASETVKACCPDIGSTCTGF